MKRKFLPLILFLALLVIFPARAQQPFSLTAVHRNLSYVMNGHARQKLDLYLPSPPAVRTWEKPPTGGYKRNLPLIIWIHGGAWLIGSKDDTVPLDLLAEGYAVASIDYRLSGDAKFPAQIEDCKTAVRWLRANAKRYGLDAERFAAFGESAGGHLAAMLGTTGDTKEFDVGENLDQSSRVQAVVDFYGASDFLQKDAHFPPNKKRGLAADANSPESRLIGGAIMENKDKAAKANPITYITKTSAPFLLVHGDADLINPHHQSELLATALKKAHVPAMLYTVKGGGHGDFDDPQIRRLISAFLAKHLSKKRVVI